VEEAAMNIPQGRGTGEQFLAQISKTPGVKPEEIKWIGLDDFLQGKKSVTKQEVQDYISRNRVDVQEVQLGKGSVKSFEQWAADQGFGPEAIRDFGPTLRNSYEAFKENASQKIGAAKFSGYTLPGGENYREILLTLPQKPVAPINTEKSPATMLFERDMMEKYGSDSFPSIYNRLSPSEIDKYEMYVREDRNTAKTESLLRDRRTTFRSSHFDQPNILAHMRANDRVVDGKKTLFIEEIQSDWGQKGREAGFIDERLLAAKRAEYDALLEKSTEAHQSLMRDTGIASTNRISDAEYARRVAESQEMRRAVTDAARELVGLESGSKIPSAPFVTKTEGWLNLALKRAIQEASEKGYDQIAFTTGKTQAERYDLSKQVKEIEYIKRGDKYELGITDIRGEGVNLPKTEFSASELENVVGKEIAQKIVKGEGRKYRGHEGITLEGLDLKVGGEGMKSFYDNIVPKALEKIGKKFDARVGKTNMDGVEVWQMNITPKMRESVTSRGQPLFQLTAPAAGMLGAAAMRDEEKRFSRGGDSTRGGSRDRLSSELRGIGQTLATVGSGAAATLAGMPYGLIKGLTSGQFLEGKAADIAAREAQKFIQAYTYDPTSEEAQRNLQTLGSLADASKVPPIVPEAIPLAATFPRGAAAQTAQAPLASTARSIGVSEAGLSDVPLASYVARPAPKQEFAYETAQEGPFYRVRPRSAQASGSAPRGIREEVQPSGSVSGSDRGNVPEPISDEAIRSLIKDPGNFVFRAADKYSKAVGGVPYQLPDMPPSSLAKQSAIGRAFQIAAEDDDAYKRAVFEAYGQKLPRVVEASGARNYDQLVEAAYRQLAKETSDQFRALPINMSYHRFGEGNYSNSGEMLRDVYGNRHLYVFQGGDPHTFLNVVDPKTGLNTNEMFRAVHDFYGHAIHGNPFGPKGEEIAYGAHAQMFSPLARMAMATETRGQNSFVNYTPINAELKQRINRLNEARYEANRRGQKADVAQIDKLLGEAWQGFQFAPQKSALLPPEFLDIGYTGGMPGYLQGLISPKPGTGLSERLTHYSNVPDLTATDPFMYGSGIRGREMERLRGTQNPVMERSYFYAGDPASVRPESGLGPYRYGAEAENLYDVTKDPLMFRALAAEANRAPFTAKYNQGLTDPNQAFTDIERMAKEYGYSGLLNPQQRTAIMYQRVPVKRFSGGGLSAIRGAPPRYRK
jgi:hypothetical protein